MGNLRMFLLALIVAILCFSLAWSIAVWKDNQLRVQFKENYRIDLKQDGYLVYKCHNGEIVFVPTDSLELFFLDDNL